MFEGHRVMVVSFPIYRQLLPRPRSQATGRPSSGSSAPSSPSKNDEWAVARRYTSLETITACYTDNLANTIEEEQLIAISS